MWWGKRKRVGQVSWSQFLEKENQLCGAGEERCW